MQRRRGPFRLTRTTDIAACSSMKDSSATEVAVRCSNPSLKARRVVGDTDSGWTVIFSSLPFIPHRVNPVVRRHPDAIRETL